MSHSLRWTSESKKTFNQNLEYLSEEWDNQVINNFLDRIEEVLTQLKPIRKYIPYTASMTMSINALYTSG